MNAEDTRHQLALLRIDVEEAGKRYRWTQKSAAIGGASRSDVDAARESYAAAWTAYDAAMEADAEHRRAAAVLPATSCRPGPASRRSVIVKLRCVGDLGAKRCERRPLRHTFRVDRWCNIDRWDRDRGCWTDDQRLSLDTQRRLRRIANGIAVGVVDPRDVRVYARTANDVEERGLNSADPERYLHAAAANGGAT